MEKMVSDEVISGFYDDIEDFDVTYEQDENQAEDASEERAVSAQDAFTMSRRNRCGVDLEYMSRVSGLSEEELVDELAYSAMWLCPEKYELTGDISRSWVTREQYLKGNLYRKLAKAQELEKRTGLFGETIKLLKEHLPEQVDFEDIRINLGATWVPAQYVIHFVATLLKMVVPPSIEYDAFQGRWSVQCSREPDWVENYFTYGTKRMSAISIIRHILNATAVKVYDPVMGPDGKEEHVLNKAETRMAQDKQRLIQERWQEFIREDSRVEEKLQECYMDRYGYTISHYNGDYLKFEDMNPEIQLYEHQKNAIARILVNHNTLLAHEVGSGKTPEYMCGIHELIRLGFGKKAMITAPNDSIDEVAETYEKLYPQDKVLTVYYQKNFSSQQRWETIREMMGDYQVIIIAYSSFDMLTMSHEYMLERKYEVIRECRAYMQTVKNAATRKSLETKLKHLAKEAQKFQEEDTDRETACFEYLGVDILVVDEAHNYKNITIDNRMDNIVGMHAKGSGKADNLLEKVRYIQGLDGHVIFATGTPLTNSLADLYVMQVYLQPEELRICRIEHFSDWVNCFCTQVHSFEMDVDAQNFRFVTRFSQFHNLPELMSMFSEVCDFYQIEAGKLGLPDFKGYTNVVVKKSDIQRAYIEEIAERTEMIRARKVRRTEDNLLKVTTDGRKCSLDIRLVVPDALTGEEENKCRVCAERMAELYRDFPGTTQIAFADISTPKEGFNIYDELKKELVLRGVKASEIVFIHEATTLAKRNRIERDFNSGKIRILIGSTQKLGTGANVQEKLLAVHHLDVPWRPADMVQREGRIIRQGNTCEQVYIFRYVTEASFDSYIWQLLENKQRFIAQFLSGSMDSIHRDESDCADTILNYAEIKALAIGNPLIRRRVEVANELEHARISQRQKRKELGTLQELLLTMPRKIKERQNLLHYVTADLRSYSHSRQSIPMEERECFGEELLFALKGNAMREEESRFDVYQGFDVVLPRLMDLQKPYVILRRNGSNSYMVKMDGDSAVGCSRRLDYVLDHLEDRKKEHEAQYQALLGQQRQMEKLLDEGNTFDAEVKRLMAELQSIDAQLEEGKAS